MSVVTDDAFDALTARLRADPGDRDGWRVYADALLERGDPRGDALDALYRLGDDAQPWGSPEARVACADRYAASCRAIRWPAGGPWPPIAYRDRFEAMFRELRAQDGADVRVAVVGPPTDPAEIERWREVAGPAWPDGMTELYTELDRVELDCAIGEDGYFIRIPPLRSVWDYAALENELWFDFLGDDHEFHEIRPIDRFVPEAYAVLSPVPARTRAVEQARVAYNNCGEQLSSTGLTYREWLELLFRSRGVSYWLKLCYRSWNPDPAGWTWVEEGIDRAARRFPDFEPSTFGRRPV